MKLGFTLSPGGLLFPYHIGVLTTLTEKNYITPSTPLAGSSAGAIAVASHAVGVPSHLALDGCVRISQKCADRGGARGRLMPLLEEELRGMLPPDAHTIVNEREGFTGLAYREIFPRGRNVLQDTFATKEDLIEAVCNSSMFPFFTSNLPFVVRPGRRMEREEGEGDVEDERLVVELSDGSTYGTAVDVGAAQSSSAATTTTTGNRSPSPTTIRQWGTGLPRLIVDGYFTVDRNRFGCPVFPDACGVEREITVSVFPHDVIGLDVSEERNRISPVLKDGDDTVAVLEGLLRGATQASTAREHEEMYLRGCEDAARWVAREEEEGGYERQWRSDGNLIGEDSSYLF